MALEDSDPRPGDLETGLLRKILLRLRSLVGAVEAGGSPIIGPITIAPEDIEIGAVEIKDSTTDDRTKVLAANPVGTEFGVVTRNIPSGTQPVSGSISVSNFPAIQPISGSVSVSSSNSDGVVSTNNSSSTPLAGSATFIGTGDDVTEYNSISVSVFADTSGGVVPGASAALTLDWSENNVNWTSYEAFTYSAGGRLEVVTPTRKKYFRVEYRNSATPQVTFRLQVVLKSGTMTGDVLAIDPNSALAPASPAPMGLVTRNIPGGTQVVSSTQLPAALVGTRLDINNGAWLGSTAPTVGSKTSANSVPVVIASDQGPVSGTIQGTLTNRSGSMATGGVSQQVMAANATRKYLIFENVSTEDMWINFTTAAVAAQPSFLIKPNGQFVMEAGFVSTEALNVISATTSSQFVAKES